MQWEKMNVCLLSDTNESNYRYEYWSVKAAQSQSVIKPPKPPLPTCGSTQVGWRTWATYNISVVYKTFRVIFRTEFSMC